MDDVHNPASHDDHQCTFTGVYTTEKILLAASKGPKILKIHEIWHFPQVFKTIMKRFYHLKVARSGWPGKNMTDYQKRSYLADLHKTDDICLEPADIVDNPLMRLLNKVILNFLWGGSAMRPNNLKSEYVTKSQRFEEFLFSEQKLEELINFLDDETVQIQYKESEDISSFDPTGSIILAIFVTSYARIRLFKAMEKVGREKIDICRY